MENNQTKTISKIITALIVVLSLFLIYFGWNFLKISPATHANKSKKSYDLKTSTLEQIKNPSSQDFKAKSQTEGRINPFAPY